MADTDRDAGAVQPYGVRPPGYRLPDATHVGRVRLQVADLRRSLDYYERVLGMRPASHGTGSVTLTARLGTRPLVELHERRGVNAVPRRGLLGLYHYALLLPDRAALGRFASHLARIGERAGASDHLVSEALYLTDPDGLGIEVYADRPRAEWEHRAGEIVMATAPLDVAALARDAGGDPWDGMPAGMVLGHVHLHVGDIAEGSAFYHDALGFDRMVWSYPGALFLAAGGYHHHLGTNVWARDARPASDEDARLLDWELVLPDGASVGAATASLAGAGYRVEIEGDDGVLARDPWGTAVRLVAGERHG